MGLHAAVELARKGLTVVATMRDTSRAGGVLEAARAVGADLDIRALDVTDHPAAQAVLAGIAADHGRIDVLVNNAGRGSVGSAEQLSLQDVRDQLEHSNFRPSPVASSQ